MLWCSTDEHNIQVYLTVITFIYIHQYQGNNLYPYDVFDFSDNNEPILILFLNSITDFSYYVEPITEMITLSIEAVFGGVFILGVISYDIIALTLFGYPGIHTHNHKYRLSMLLIELHTKIGLHIIGF